ncbi:hypothetical protein PWKp5_00019 [Klebsiella phage PWKp5]|nr:hypothetical protein PWKp5_00019 [Klebsiella phage PWKp5]
MACMSSISKLPPLKWSGNEHSVYARIISAVKEGRESIELFRPAVSSKAHRDTYALLNNLRSLGVNVEPMPCSNPMVNLFVLSNFEYWK